MRAEKTLLRDEIREMLDSYGTFVIMGYSGLTANAAGSFRNEVVKLGGGLEVVKKRVLLKAAEAAGVHLSEDALQGHIGLVFAGEDPIPITKLVCKMSKETNEQVVVLGGRFDGSLYSADQVKMLAELPGKDEMRAQLLAVFEAPMQQTVSVMNTLLTSIVYCLENKSKES